MRKIPIGAGRSVDVVEFEDYYRAQIGTVAFTGGLIGADAEGRLKQDLKDAALLPTQPAHSKACDLACIGQDQHGSWNIMQLLNNIEKM